jgi:hypothetical protein
VNVDAMVNAGGAVLARGHAASASARVAPFEVAPIRVLPGANVTLSPGQMLRIAQAADLAESKGIGRALVMIDGKVLRLDVATRTITAAAEASATVVEGDCDGVIALGAERHATVAPMNLLARLGAGRG